MIEKSLRLIINSARTSNQLLTRDWKNYPLPALPREKNAGM